MADEGVLVRPNLRRRLVGLDAVAVGLAWLPTLLWKYSVGAPLWKCVFIGLVLLATGIGAMSLQGLYLARVASSRPEEIKRIIRVSITVGVVQAFMLLALDIETERRWVYVGPVLLAFTLLWLRGGFRAWLAAERAAGRNLRDVLVLGTNADAAEMVAMLMDHPEAGFRVRGVAGDRAIATANGLGHLHLGECDQVPDLLRKHGVTGVIIVVGAMPSSVMSPLVEQLSEDGVHVQVSNGLHGVSHRRFRVTPVAFQSLYYLEPATTRNATVVLKRVGDVVVASLALLLSLPITLVAAVAVKATDRGPLRILGRKRGRTVRGT